MAAPDVAGAVRVFISYRRGDTSGYAGRLYEAFAFGFGGSNVFVDVDKIEAGSDFAEVITAAVLDCDVLVALIGPSWLARRFPWSRRRLDDRDDFVRLELAAALRRGIPIVPVLVQGARMPDRATLPDELRELAGRQAFEMSDQRWSRDIPVLIQRIQRLTAVPSVRVEGAGADGPERRPGDQKLRVGCVVSVALTLVAVVVAAVATLTVPSGGVGVTPPVTATPASPPTSSRPADVVFADDFSGPVLDPTRWTVSEPTDHVRQEDGRLLLSTRPGDGVDYVSAEPDLSGDFTDVRFTVVVPPYARAGQGGGSLVINPRGAQPQLLAMGPGADGGVLVAPLTCERPECRLGRYEDFQEPDYSDIADQQPGDPIAVEISRRDGRLVYLLNGQEIAATTTDPGPLTELWFAVSSGGEESWDIYIDDLVIS